MSRPEFPIGIVLPASCIQRIREDQQFYDKNPEYCDRMQREREEERQREQETERDYYNQQGE